MVRRDIQEPVELETVVLEEGQQELAPVGNYEFAVGLNGLPAKQGLYDPELEKDACGVGFSCHIKGKVSHKIVSDARSLLCNLSHRGAVGADTRDGDGAGVMTSMPHKFVVKEFATITKCQIPPKGEYAFGNVFFSPDDELLDESKKVFTELAESLELRVLGWRTVPRDSTIIGPAARSREPTILQPVVVLAKAYGQGESYASPDKFDVKFFERQLYVLRKQSTHRLGLEKWFYICSLSNNNVVYKGQLAPVQVYNYYLDLCNSDYEAHFALVHSRFSTNTFPSWDRAQPMRLAAHNGEINTLRGNKNWMRAREGLLKSTLFADELELLLPIIEEGGSDSAAFDNCLELLVINGVLSLPEAVMLMVPEAWEDNQHMDDEKKAFYEWAACNMEPWDGPALFTFADGRYCGANLDRNGLRPCRFYITTDDIMICASEVGTIMIEPEKILQKGRLQPGKMLLVDTVEGRVVDDKELKHKTSSRCDFSQWTQSQLLTLDRTIEKLKQQDVTLETAVESTPIAEDKRLLAFGYSLEQLNLLVAPMATEGKEAFGSMGNDGALACLAPQARLMFDYFRQLFAQVTNPPIDPIREAMVMSLTCYVGPQGNLLEMNAKQCARLKLESPILLPQEMEAIKQMTTVYPSWKVQVLDLTFAKSDGPAGYRKHLDEICQQTEAAISEGYKVVVLSDKATSEDRVPLSSLVAVGAVHHFLVKSKLRSRVALVAETADCREVHHACTMVGYGADAIYPWLVMEAIAKLAKENALKKQITAAQGVKNYRKAIDAGILKTMSKMGISTLQSYKGAQIFEALGVDDSVIDVCFVGTASRIKGITFEYIARDAFAFHEKGYPDRHTINIAGLPESGEYHWRDGGESRINNPTSIATLQDAVRSKNQESYDKYTKSVQQSIKDCTLRGMLDFDFSGGRSIDINQVEPWTEIVRRFCTGAMSYGSISMEAHSALAIAMNRLGGKSNSGEGGEDLHRSIRLANGDSMRSAIKQIASGRFGVTSAYLADADELQIKMAQGAKPGEGGSLPGNKVSESIARTRHTTPGVTLHSPAPHHDIYSIEDLKQLIYDLKCSNPRARVSVKLVSEVGCGIVAAGVAKARADHILISGHDGGTGAAPWTGIKYTGLPFELGLAETHQTLVLNDLRGRICLQTDGQIKTGRDAAIAILLGAEELGVATAPLIALGCIMMKKCHLNTCPVGVATTDPQLRKKFQGSPESVINFVYYLAEELRGIMAKLGFRTVDEMVGRTDRLRVRDDLKSDKQALLDLGPILTPAYTLRPGAATYNVRRQDHRLYIRLDNKLIDEAEWTLEKGIPSQIDCQVINTDRAIGATLSNKVSKKYGEAGLPDDSIHVNLYGSAGQSFGAFLAPGITLELEGDANDYVGKGLSGGHIAVYPPKNSIFNSEENIIVGNVCLYGATAGKAYFRGIAAERFAVRNSGALAVVEGVGDHGCEYMTGGVVVILGSTGRNFAAGMSGGRAFVLDMAQDFASKVNMDGIELSKISDPAEIALLRGMIEDHRQLTGSEIADRILQNFHRMLDRFVKVLPTDYRKVLEAQAAKAAEAKRSEFQAKFPAHESPKPAAAANEPKVLDLEDSVADSEGGRKKPLDKVKGFMTYSRKAEKYREAKKRTGDWEELSGRLTTDELRLQTARCMDCGVPFCQSDYGCPISNIIPQWNELVFNEQWKDALDRLLMTNNFPEFTGRVCPAPCEGACVLGINEAPVGIKSVECAIIDRGFEMGWMTPKPPQVRTGKTVAIVGSGPAGLSAADQLNKAGHHVTVYERADRIGGLLMYGIPNMKLDKGIVQRRVDLMAAEGIKFVTSCNVGVDVTIQQLQSEFDSVLLSTGATIPRDMKIPGRNVEGIIFAMEFLHQNTKSLLDSKLADEKYISAKGKNVIVIGGGDTGNDCLGTSVRHGAKSVLNFELLPQPPAGRAKDNPWPQFPRVFKVDYGHAEVQAHYGNDPREYCIMSNAFTVDEENNKVTGVETTRVEWTKNEKGQWNMAKVVGSEKFFPADLVILAMGFLGPEEKLITDLPIKRDPRSNFATPAGSYATSVDGIYACGDCRRGQSLVVWAINEGRSAALQIDRELTGLSLLPQIGGIIARTDLQQQQVPVAA